MSRNVIALLDKARKLCEPPTDYRLSKQLDINTATISRCRNRGGTLDNAAAWKLAEFLQLEPADVIALMEADRATTKEQRAFWLSHAPRALPSVALVAATLIAAGGSLTDGVRADAASQQSVNLYYGKLKLWLAIRSDPPDQIPAIV